MTTHDEDKIIAQQARIEQLTNFIKYAQVSSGVCCCGDSMEGHPSPMTCGHSPVDMWDYHSGELLEAYPDDLSALRAHDEKLLAPHQWQPIETAPKDGTEIILWFPFKDIAINGLYGEVSEGDWETGYRKWMEWLVADELWFQEDPSQAPTHWMPLPSTEAIEKGGE